MKPVNLLPPAQVKPWDWRLDWRTLAAIVILSMLLWGAVAVVVAWRIGVFR